MSEPDVTSLMSLGQVVLTLVILVFLYGGAQLEAVVVSLLVVERGQEDGSAELAVIELMLGLLVVAYRENGQQSALPLCDRPV
jgi:hypothetical protein